MKLEIENIYRQHTGKMLAYLCCILKDLDKAEEIWHDIVAGLFEKEQDLPSPLLPWLKTCAKNKAIDHLRKQQLTLQKSQLVKAIATELTDLSQEEALFNDQQLKLIFACCHPALEFDKQVALTLNVVCGMSTEQIATALLIQTKTLEQRLTRAKRKIKLAGIPYEIPEQSQLTERVQAVLKTLYLLFNNAVNHPHDPFHLESDAIQLCTFLHKLIPQEPEITGCLALMLFHHSRRASRFDSDGNLIVLPQQNRKKWDQTLIRQADKLIQEALNKKQIGVYQLQGAIQGLHSLAESAEDTDWRQIESLYYVLLNIEDSPVIRLNAAVAISESQGVDSALIELAHLESEEELKDYASFYIVKAELLFKKGQPKTAIENLEIAKTLTNISHEKRHLDNRIHQIKIISQNN